MNSCLCSLLLHEVLELLLVLIAYFDHHTWVLSKERLHDIAILADVVQVDVHTTLGIGEAHLQQSGDQTTGRDIVTSHNPTLLNQLLNSHEGIGEVLGVLYRRHIVAHLTQTLGKGRTTQTLLVEREVDMIE